MIKEISYSVYIFPVRNGRVALLKYGDDGYGPIGGRLDDCEKFSDALGRELVEELGVGADALLKDAFETPVSYKFKHSLLEQAEKRGAWAEEHHFYIAQIPDDFDIEFCESRPEKVSVVWVSPDELVSPNIIPFDDMRVFYATHIVPNLACRFSMNLQHQYYEMIKSGEKDIELRLYDEKRRKMRNGDMLLIYDAQNPSDYIRCIISRLHIAKSFADLSTKISMPRTGFPTLNALLGAVSKFYSPDMETKHGIVGIELMFAE